MTLCRYFFPAAILKLHSLEHFTRYLFVGMPSAVQQLEQLILFSCAVSEALATIDHVDDLLGDYPDLANLVGVSKEEVEQTLAAIRTITDAAYRARRNLVQDLATRLQDDAYTDAEAPAPSAAHGPLSTTSTPEPGAGSNLN